MRFYQNYTLLHHKIKHGSLLVSLSSPVFQQLRSTLKLTNITNELAGYLYLAFYWAFWIKHMYLSNCAKGSLELCYTFAKSDIQKNIFDSTFITSKWKNAIVLEKNVESLLKSISGSEWTKFVFWTYPIYC